MAEKRTNTSFLIGLAISACAHIAALYGLQHVKIDSTRPKVSLASLRPLSSVHNQPRPPEQKPPPDPTQQRIPDPPKDLDKDVKFGIDDSKIDSNTWLGFLEGDSPSGRQGETDQAAMALDPGDPGTAMPGNAGSAGTQPSPPASESAPQPAAPRPPDLMNLRPPTPTDAPKSPEDLTPKKPEEAAPSPSRSAPPQVAPPVGQTGEKTTVDDPLAPRAGAENSTAGQSPQAVKPVESPKPEGVEEEKPKLLDAKEGVEREGEVRETEAEKMSAENGKGEAEKEVKEVAEASPLAKPDEALPPVAVAPPTPASPAAPQEETPASQASPASSATPNSPPTPATGGQSKQRGIRSDRESEAFSKKVIDAPMRDGRVQAGKGLNIRTRRADFTNTTLLTAPPRDTMVRISFQKNGIVKRAEFINGSATGNPNVDDPLMNAIYRWQAAGKDLSSLGADETLSVVVRVTFK